MNNITDLERELIYWSDKLVEAERKFTIARVELEPLEAMKKTKFALIESEFDTDKQAVRSRLALISKDWRNFNTELTKKQIAYYQAQGEKNVAQVKFETIRSLFSFRKQELTMLGSEYDSSKIRG
jgi:hypothetical protein